HRAPAGREQAPAGWPCRDWPGGLVRAGTAGPPRCGVPGVPWGAGCGVLAARPWRTAAAAMDARIHRAGPAGRRDGCPNSHPISLMRPLIHRTKPRKNRAPGRDETPNPSHRTMAWAGHRGAMDARIHRTGPLIMEKLGVIPHGHVAATYDAGLSRRATSATPAGPRPTRPPLTFAKPS